jgi:hypothetical protein
MQIRGCRYTWRHLVCEGLERSTAELLGAMGMEEVEHLAMSMLRDNTVPLSAPRTTVEGDGSKVASGSTEQRHYDLTVTSGLERSPVFD